MHAPLAHATQACWRYTLRHKAPPDTFAVHLRHSQASWRTLMRVSVAMHVGLQNVRVCASDRVQVNKGCL